MENYQNEKHESNLQARIVSLTHTCTHTHRYCRARVEEMVCFLMTQAITKLSWQLILRQINAGRFNTRRGPGGGGLSEDWNSPASFDRKPIIPIVLFSQARSLVFQPSYKG